MSELAGFVLNAFRQAGALVDEPGFGRYDVLLPQEVAWRWQVPAYQRMAFSETAEAAAEAVTTIGYGHPLLDRLVEEVRAEPACMEVFVNRLRTDKRGLLSLARQALAFPNARVSELPRQSEVVAECHYARFDFKAALVTDEKWEQLVSVVMDVQSGLAVPELARLETMDRRGHRDHLPMQAGVCLPDQRSDAGARSHQPGGADQGANRVPAAGVWHSPAAGAIL